MSAPVPAVRPQRLERYRPPGEGAVRDSLLAVLDSFPEEKRMGVALAYAVDMLDTMGTLNLSPAGRRLGHGVADAIRDLVPPEAKALIDAAKAKHRK